jgi:hypothetical protein
VLRDLRGNAEKVTADEAAADEAAASPGGWRAARPRLVWTVAALATCVVLFWCYLRQSQTAGVNADGAGTALQGWDMLHGNLLLSGWWLADVTFYTFEVPVDALVEATRGLDADVVHISAALIYTLLVLTAALLAKGTARGAEGVIRTLLAVGVMVAPAVSPGTRTLILTPDHTGVGVPILLTLLLVDRLCQQESEGRARWWVPLAVGVLLVWAQVEDPLATVAAAAPIALVCLVRAGALLVRRRRFAWSAPLLFDGALAVAAVVSVQLASLAVAAIKSAGGYSMQPLGSNIGKLVPTATWGHQLWVTGENLLILFGADFYEQPAGIRTAIAFLHFAGVALAACGLLIGITCLVRGGDRVTQILTVAALATVGAGALATKMLPIQGAHDIAVVLPFGAVLAGRTLGPWLARLPRRRLPRITLLPLLGAALACYLAALGYSASQPAVPAETQGLADWLVAHHLTSGLGKYWAASSTTLASGGRVRVAPAQGAAGNVAYPWVTKPSWYDPAVSTANFVIATPGRGNAYAFNEAAVRHSYGKPSHVYHYGSYVIMVWNKNLLLQVPAPNQSHVGGH